MDITYCIAAFNEERTIGDTIGSILRQQLEGEILVCANACTDQTAQVARDHGAHVIETPTRGKPNAWNILTHNATSRYRCFVDADVLLAEDCTYELAERMKKDDLKAVGARDVVLPGGWTSKYLHLSTDFPGCLVGRCYLLDWERSSEVTGRMPDVLGEDLWLTKKLGHGNWAIEPNAKAFMQPYNLRDYTRTLQRAIMSYQQISENFPELDEGNGLTPNKKMTKRLLDKLNILSELPAQEAVRHLVAWPIRKACLAYAKATLPQEIDHTWEPATSSKKSFESPLYH